jgi:hypothetical protein
VSLPVRTTPEADMQIRAIDDWWRENRPTSPDLFLDELSAAFGIIGDARRSAACIDTPPYRARVVCCSTELDTTFITSRAVTRRWCLPRVIVRDWCRKRWRPQRDSTDCISKGPSRREVRFDRVAQ